MLQRMSAAKRPAAKAKPRPKPHPAAQRPVRSAPAKKTVPRRSPDVVLSKAKGSGRVSKDPIIADGYKRGADGSLFAIYLYKGKRYVIPIDMSGRVSQEDLARHMLDVQAGARPGHQRSVGVDVGRQAKVVINAGKNPSASQIVEWWANPNALDLAGVDDKNSPMFGLELAKVRRSSQGAQHNTAIIGTGNALDRKKIRETYSGNFTDAELKTLTKGGDNIIKVDNSLRSQGALGTFTPRTQMIRYDSSGLDSDTIVHEAVHKLRYKDTARTGKVTQSQVRKAVNENRHVSARERNLEEAGTVAETTARVGPYNADPASTGYYYRVAQQDRERRGASTGGGPLDRMEIHNDAKHLYCEDRKNMAGNAASGSYGVKGEKAIETTEQKFKISNIGRMKPVTDRGKTMKREKSAAEVCQTPNNRRSGGWLQKLRRRF